MPSTAIVEPQPGDEVTSSWGISVAEALNGIQSGTGTVPAAAAPTSQVTVVFPRPYLAAPHVVCNTLGTTSGIWIVNTASITATQFNAYAFARDARNVSAVGFVWIATGVPA